jgi:hypothetical protein
VLAFADRLVRTGFRAEYGVGRHGPGSNIFLYTRGPCGNRVEFCADMALVPEGTPPRIWQGLDDSIINSWAPYGPPRNVWEITAREAVQGPRWDSWTCGRVVAP